MVLELWSIAFPKNEHSLSTGAMVSWKEEKLQIEVNKINEDCTVKYRPYHLKKSRYNW